MFSGRWSSYAYDANSNATAFNQNTNALAIGLGRAGSHEIAHYLLQQNFDSPMIRGVMNNDFSGAQWFSNATQGQWTFSASQIMAMNRLCAISTPTEVPNTSPDLRPPIGGGDGGDGGAALDGYDGDLVIVSQPDQVFAIKHQRLARGDA